MSKGGAADYGKEILDVVDKNDNVIGQMSKKQIHEGDNIIHREIGILIYDRSGNLLLQQRSRKKQLFASEWSVTVTEHVLSGQSPEDAAHIELNEELGFDTKLYFVEKRQFNYENHSSFGYIFIGEFPHHVMISPDRDELERASFFKKEEVRKMINSGKIGKISVLTIENYLNGVYNLSLKVGSNKVH